MERLGGKYLTQHGPVRWTDAKYGITGSGLTYGGGGATSPPASSRTTITITQGTAPLINVYHWDSTTSFESHWLHCG
ncbi:MAG: hypothetical protein ACR2P2_17290 [Nakamurella sp.]